MRLPWGDSRPTGLSLDISPHLCGGLSPSRRQRVGLPLSKANHAARYRERPDHRLDEIADLASCIHHPMMIPTHSSLPDTLPLSVARSRQKNTWERFAGAPPRDAQRALILLTDTSAHQQHSRQAHRLLADPLRENDLPAVGRMVDTVPARSHRARCLCYRVKAVATRSTIQCVSNSDSGCTALQLTRSRAPTPSSKHLEPRHCCRTAPRSAA